MVKRHGSQIWSRQFDSGSRLPSKGQISERFALFISKGGSTITPPANLYVNPLRFVLRTWKFYRSPQFGKMLHEEMHYYIRPAGPVHPILYQIVD